MRNRILGTAFVAAALFASCAWALAGGVTGTFVQLNRASANLSVEQWAAALDRMSSAGIRTIIVQWSAEGSISYFRTDLPFTEQYPALEHLFAAAKGKDFQIVLGLQNDPGYWKQIGARDRVLRDYFMTRVGQNIAVQKALLKKFGSDPDFTGYYIPDELDDLNWRAPDRRAIARQYLSTLASELRAADADRPTAISAFFRGRTAPDLFAANLAGLFDTPHHLDIVMVQDGVGVGDPPQEYVSIYFKELRQSWPKSAPALWGVIEAFEQTSKSDEPFAARPAPAGRLRDQIKTAEPFFDRLILFTFLDYADSSSGAGAQPLFEVLKETR